MDYADYLRLDRLLDAQAPLTDAPDEPLFIVSHQVSELWMKLLLKELGDARDGIARDNLGFAFRALTRASRILEQMVRMWDVLSTMTPTDYRAFRDALGTSSGFQSLQYRLIEFELGARDPARLDAHRHRPEALAQLEAALARPSLRDEAHALLGRRGFPASDEAEIARAWAAVYADTGASWDLYELAEKLVDIEHRLQIWRFTHMKTVERIIGYRRGTGGTSGVAYLESVLKRGFFPELLAVRTAL
ncbi:MAG: tryptophan 2,3-dioxygenase [Thermaurantiacus sp.]